MRTRTGKKMLIFMLVAVISLTLITGCASNGGGSGASSDGSIKIGASFPLSGSVAADGEMIINAINLAAKEYNEAGGIDGREIEIVTEDDEADPTTATSVANKFAENSEIMAVLTSYNSSCALAQIPVYKEAGLSAVSPVATSPDIIGLSDYFYRTCNNDAFGGTMSADYAQAIGFSKIAVLYQQDDYGYGVYEKFTKRAEEIGLDIVYEGTFVYGETKDFSTLLTNIKGANVDGIFVIGLVTEMALIANQAITYGVDDIPVLVGEGGYSPAMILEGGDAVEGLYSLGAFSAEADIDVVQTFVKAYEAEYGSSPSNWSALAYDAACVIFEAMKNCDTIDRGAINKAISEISYEGVTGLNEFDGSEVSKDYMKFRIENSSWVLIEE